MEVSAKQALGLRIRLARRHKGWSQADLATRLGWPSGGRVGNYEQGTREAALDDLDAIAAACQVSPVWLKTGEGDMLSAKPVIAAYEVRGIDGDGDLDPEHETMADEVDITLHGGPGAWIPEFVETKFRMPFQLWWLNRKGAKAENVKVMRVKGSSMEPLLWDGDRVVIDTGNKKIEDEGVYGLWYGGAKVKRLFVMADGRIRVVSDNPDKARYPDEFIEPNELENVFMIGRVIDKGGSGGL